MAEWSQSWACPVFSDSCLRVILKNDRLVKNKRQNVFRVKRHWEIITDSLRNAGWSCGCILSMDSQGRDVFVVVAQRDGNRFIVRADEKLAAFVEIESAIRNFGKRD
jgi:hypothetical protein